MILRIFKSLFCRFIFLQNVKCKTLFNQSFSTRPTFIDLKAYELCFDLFVVSLDR